MEMRYEMRSNNEPDIEQALKDAEENLESDTREGRLAEARALLHKAIQQAIYQVSLVFPKVTNYLHSCFKNARYHIYLLENRLLNRRIVFDSVY